MGNNNYRDKFITKYENTVLPGHLKAMNAICNCRTAASGHFMSVVPIAAIQNGNLYPVVTAVALNARITCDLQVMKQAFGSIGNRTNYYLFLTF